MGKVGLQVIIWLYKSKFSSYCSSNLAYSVLKSNALILGRDKGLNSKDQLSAILSKLIKKQVKQFSTSDKFIIRSVRLDTN